MATILLKPPQNFPPSMATLGLEPLALLPAGSALPPPTASKRPHATGRLHVSPRCSVRGCVFPAAFAVRSECRYHELLRSEAHLFQSHQPSHLLENQAPLETHAEEFDDERQRDRKRLAGEREQFLMD